MRFSLVITSFLLGAQCAGAYMASAAGAPSHSAATASASRGVAPNALLSSQQQQRRRQQQAATASATTEQQQQQQRRQQQQQQQSYDSSRLVDSFLSGFHGHFDNFGQVATNEAAGLYPREGGGHEQIHCTLTPIDIADAGAESRRHVLATYYFNGNPYAVFRERLYGFDALANDEQFGPCVRMSIYKLREETTARLLSVGVGAGDSATAAADVAFSGADLSASLRIPEADVFWRWCGERYEGEMRTPSIELVSERDPSQLLRISDDVAFWGDALWVNDRGCDAASGEYVYGNIHSVPYKMARVPDTHWSATGAGNPATPPPS